MLVEVEFIGEEKMVTFPVIKVGMKDRSPA